MNDTKIIQLIEKNNLNELSNLKILLLIVKTIIH